MKNKSLNSLQEKINSIKNLVGNKNDLVIKDIIINEPSNIEASLLYINGLVNNETISRDILKPLMLNIKEDLKTMNNLEETLCKKYIYLSNTLIEEDVVNAVFHLKRGKSILVLQGGTKFIIFDTTGGEYRSISDSINEASIRGSRESFVEKLDTNVSLLRRHLKDNNLVEEKLTIGRKSQTDLVLMYVDNIADKNIVDDIRSKLEAIDVDNVIASGFWEQFMESNSYSIFPQAFFTERPDIVQANLLEGRIAVITDGTPFVATIPAIFFEFFQAIEDYNQRTILSSFTRILRYLAIFLVITLPAIYVTFIKFNSELIPFEFLGAIIESRKGIALTPFMSILSMSMIVDFLREGGLRLPLKIAQTLSVVGGIIIGDAAIKAKIVSSTTLLVVGISTVATFLIPNYEMAVSIRLISYPMLFLGNFLGMFGIAIGWFFLIAYLCSLESYGIPYFKIHKSDLKDIIVRAPVDKFNERPKIIPNTNPTRQSNVRDLLRRKKNGK
ncbi:spore germination protein [Clostridium sp. Marseille-Q2269]|uniref:spore germination protein n=1 Tax=Clostridium sp. Marseille-Q2269 TaxID=2942205 RepID=UPI00207314F1|nr:spore germination protein [Clostridium sp. Marseille-Q2269]